jgi:sugar lactone lactonase YvrE
MMPDMELLRSSVVVDGILFGEGPRWHDGRLWLSDIVAGRVLTLDERGALDVVVETEHPSGLGWLPDGTLVFSTLFGAAIKRVDGAVAVVVHDLADRGWSTNDMVTGPDGAIYADLYTGSPGGPRQGEIVLVRPEGDVQSVATGLGTPNGLALTPDESTLLVSDTSEGKVLAFRVRPDGTLTDRRVFADLGARHPDGLCVDEENAVWVGCYDTSEFLRVREGGEITHRIETPGAWAVAPALGGADRRTLYLVVNRTTHGGLRSGESVGRIEHVRVDVAGAGWP